MSTGLRVCSCPFNDPWRCAVARNLSGQVICHCSCHGDRSLLAPREGPVYKAARLKSEQDDRDRAAPPQGDKP